MINKNEAVNNLLLAAISLANHMKQIEGMPLEDIADSGAAEWSEELYDDLMEALRPFCVEFAAFWWSQPVAQDTDQGFSKWLTSIRGQ